MRWFGTLGHSTIQPSSTGQASMGDPYTTREPTSSGSTLQKQSFLETSAPSSCSHGWHGIQHGRDLLKQNLGKAIGNKLTTRVWQDSWITLDRHNKPFGPIREEALDLRVVDSPKYWCEVEYKKNLGDHSWVCSGDSMPKAKPNGRRVHIHLATF